MTPRTLCLVCGRRRQWRGTAFWYHPVSVHPFPSGITVTAQPVLLAAPVCSNPCAVQATKVLGGRVQVATWPEAAKQGVAA